MYDTDDVTPAPTAPQPPRRSRRPLAVAAAVVLVAAAIGAAFALGRSDVPSAPAAAAVTTSAAATLSPTIAATAPSASECAAFADAYNTDVGPVLKSAGAGGNVYFTQLKDAFSALDVTVEYGSDPYSQTIGADIQAIMADPTSYTAMGAFNTDLQTFLKQCGMHSS